MDDNMDDNITLWTITGWLIATVQPITGGQKTLDQWQWSNNKTATNHEQLLLAWKVVCRDPFYFWWKRHTPIQIRLWALSCIHFESAPHGNFDRQCSQPIFSVDKRRSMKQKSPSFLRAPTTDLCLLYNEQCFGLKSTHPTKYFFKS